MKRFKWYRKWRGGKWALVPGILYGHRWVQVPHWWVREIHAFDAVRIEDYDV